MTKELLCQVCKGLKKDHTESMIKACRKQLDNELRLGQYSLYPVTALFVYDDRSLQ